MNQIGDIIILGLWCSGAFVGDSIKSKMDVTLQVRRRCTSNRSDNALARYDLEADFLQFRIWCTSNTDLENKMSSLFIGQKGYEGILK